MEKNETCCQPKKQGCRVARWYILKQKILFWAIFKVLAMEEFGLIYGHLVYFVVVLYTYFTAFW
jgi:hypothetical protein